MLGELALGFVPGSDVIFLFQSIDNNDAVGASLAVGGLIVDALGAGVIKGTIRGARVFRKAFVIARKLKRVLKATGVAAKKGFKTSLDAAGNLILKKGDRIVAAGDDVVKNYLKVAANAKEFLINPTAVNNFSDEMIAINNRFSDGGLLIGSPKTAINTALFQGNVVDQAASIFKSVARNHMFNNGNKRTAVEMFKSFAAKSGIPVNLSDDKLLDIATKVATGVLDDVSQIGAALIK